MEILRDVLGYHANEVADILDSTVESVNSALKRARASLQRRLPPIGEHEPPPAPDSPAEQALVAKFVRAYTSGDVDALVALLTADVRVSMPPIPLEYQGLDAVARFYTARRTRCCAGRSPGSATNRSTGSGSQRFPRQPS